MFIIFYGYIINDKSIIKCGIFGLLHQLLYIIYRVIFPNCNKDKKNSYFPMQGFLPKAFNFNSVYHINIMLHDCISDYVFNK